MDKPAPLAGITTQEIETSRLKQHVYFSGPDDGIPVILVHGNCASALHWEETMLALPGYRCIAPDLRGYGWTEARPLDATRGMREWADDLHALVEALGLGRFHLIGHSMGGGVAMQYAIDHPAMLRSLTLTDTVSPYGFGGTRGVDGQPVWPDFAGSGGGTVNPEFVKYIEQAERGTGNPNYPRDVINAAYYKPPFRYHREEEMLTSLLTTRTGLDFYPGDMTPSANWPNVAPGTRGVANAFCPKYANTGALADIAPQPPILWVQGADDMIVSDTSFFDFGFLGKLGLVPGWPGDEVYPPQPMVSQTRYVLDQYQANGGRVEAHTIAGAGHCCYIDQAEKFNEILRAFLASAG
ncbi:MAG: alpha/beta hydrolase [Anaerolineae bacterium]|nr:alpha/beta hydrolase [Anaerolineae bacterium]